MRLGAPSPIDRQSASFAQQLQQLQCPYLLQLSAAKPMRALSLRVAVCPHSLQPRRKSGLSAYLHRRPAIAAFSTISAPRMASGSAPITLSSLTNLHPKDLASLLLDPTENFKVAIIDVRDSDHIGGNIQGSTWIPINQFEVRIPELLRTLKDKEKVVFHCLLSQQRGPKAALTYARAKQRAEEKEATGDAKVGEEIKSKQEVCVLEGGFSSWQSRYGEEPTLTADYVKDLWE